MPCASANDSLEPAAALTPALPEEPPALELAPALLMLAPSPPPPAACPLLDAPAAALPLPAVDVAPAAP
ncbi:MAG TPA: hypothetical protein VHW01_25960 [Polyangiaceae bacterium]|nr:hypothetical protein [Polyangiaceae bacterium]